MSDDLSLTFLRMALRARGREDVLPILLASLREVSGAEAILLWKAAPVPTLEGRVGMVGAEAARPVEQAMRRALLDESVVREAEWTIVPLRMGARVVGAVAIRGASIDDAAAAAWSEWIPLARRIAEERLDPDAREEILGFHLDAVRALRASEEAPFAEAVVRIVERLLDLAPVVLLDDRGLVVACAGVARAEAERLTDALSGEAHFDETGSRFRALGPTGDLRALYILPIRGTGGKPGGGTLWALGPIERPYDATMRSLTEVARLLGESRA